MARGSIIPENILTNLPLPRRKKGDGPLVYQEIYFKPKNSKATLPSMRTCPVALMAGAEADVMDSKPEEDDMMGNDITMDDGNAETVPTHAPKLKSTITGGNSQLSDGGPDNTKRRFRKETDAERNSLFAARK